MELAYSCEKIASEAARLILRLWRPFLRVTGFLLFVSGVLFLLALVAELMDDGVYDDYTDSTFRQIAFFFLITVVFVCCIRCMIRRTANYWSSLGNSRLWRFRLTEDSFAIECGDYKFTSLMLRFASRFLICDDALYLYGDLGQIVCFPDWIGHGVERSELAAMLENAGLKDGSRSHARKIVRWLIPFVICASLAWSCANALCHAHANLRGSAVQVELKRQLFELVRAEIGVGVNPYDGYWSRNGNMVQRMVARRFSYGFDRYYYIFDKKSKWDQVGLAAREGDVVWLVFLPCGYIETVWASEWDERKWREGVFYQESEKERWLDKVRELDVSALQECKDEDD